MLGSLFYGLVEVVENDDSLKTVRVQVENLYVTAVTGYPSPIEHAGQRQITVRGWLLGRNSQKA